MNDSSVTVYTTGTIVANIEQVHFVFHDEDGEWHFMPNRAVSEKEAALVSIKQMLQLDPSIEEIMSLPCKCMAIKNEHGIWLQKKML